ncbi:MAG: hypothetical protein WC435_03730 [Candidatus Paceibacterota bacterium]
MIFLLFVLAFSRFIDSGYIIALNNLVVNDKKGGKKERKKDWILGFYFGIMKAPKGLLFLP